MFAPQNFLMDQLPSISKAYYLLAQHDSTLPVESPSSDSNALAVSSNHISQSKGFQGHNRGKGNRPPTLCTHFNKTNHTIENCYFKHDFPSKYKSKSQLEAIKHPNSLVTHESNTSQSNSKVTTCQQQADSSLPISRDDYQFLVNLLKTSQQDSYNSSYDSNQRVVSSISKSDNILNSKSVWILD